MITILLFLAIINIVIKIIDLTKVIKKIKLNTLQFHKLYKDARYFLYEIIFYFIVIEFLLCYLLKIN